MYVKDEAVYTKLRIKNKMELYKLSVDAGE